MADTDGDGVTDDLDHRPRNPAWFPGDVPWQIGHRDNLEFGPGGLATLRTLWEYGLALGGPEVGAVGNQVWATGIDRFYEANMEEHLYLPPLDLTAASDPTLSFRVWQEVADSADGLYVERRNGSGVWELVPVQNPPQDNNIEATVDVWGDVGYRQEYELAIVRLADFVGDMAEIRIGFRSDEPRHNHGAYLDDFALFEEADDPDGDGITGVWNEFVNEGSDPFFSDSDGDGVDDPSDNRPLNPAWYPDAEAWTPGRSTDFEWDDGGVATRRSLWVLGDPSEGAWSGQRAWVTGLESPYYDRSREYLYLPPMDLTGATDPTLSFRLHQRVAGSGDGLSVERRMFDGSWQAVTVLTPDHTGTGPEGNLVWERVGYQSDGYELAMVSLRHLGGGGGGASLGLPRRLRAEHQRCAHRRPGLARRDRRPRR